jgi:acyl carrier protein
MAKTIEQLEAEVLKIIADELDTEPEKLLPAASLTEDLHADSLALINIVMQIEESFNINVPEKDWRALRTIGDILAYVERTSAAQESGKETPQSGIA